MNQTRIVFWLGCLVGWMPSVAADELLRREGRYLRLTTDLPSAAEAELLVASFDAAVPQWIEFWKLPADALNHWKVDACVMRNQAVFERKGLIPKRVPDFPFGYALGNSVWVRAQPSEYYTRHLLLHEGVHSLAFDYFGGAGPPWFMEGTAELLATHRGSGESIQVNQIPINRESVPYWGRFKMMEQLRDKSLVPPIETVLNYAPNLLGDVESYGWSWAAVSLFDAYPEYRKVLLAAAANGRDQGPSFNRRFDQRLAGQWPVVTARWRVMCHDLDYGFQWQQQRLKISVSDPLWDRQPLRLNVKANQGWQSSGVRIPAGTTLALTATGQITLAQQPKPWISEPAGVTIQYQNDRPLGQLLVCLLPNATERSGTLSALEIHSVTEDSTIKVPQTGWLIFRVNDQAGSLSDNTGHYQVRIQASETPSRLDVRAGEISPRE